jgi:hypothetical protein
MEKVRNGLFSVLLLAPMTAFAHGEEVLLTLLLEVIVLLTFTIVLFMINLNAKGKLIIGAISIMTIVSTFIVANKLPYNKYQTLINTVVVAVPVTVGVISYLGLRNRFQKE